MPPQGNGATIISNQMDGTRGLHMDNKVSLHGVFRREFARKRRRKFDIMGVENLSVTLRACVLLTKPLPGFGRISKQRRFAGRYPYGCLAPGGRPCLEGCNGPSQRASVGQRTPVSMNQEKLIERTHQLIADSSWRMRNLVERLVRDGCLDDVDPEDLAMAPKALLYTALQCEARAWKLRNRRAQQMAERFRQRRTR